MRGTDRRKWLVVPLLFVLLVACGKTAEQDRTVARINGQALTRGELDDYLAANLADEIDDDLVRTSLFDRWIEERLLFAEAVERMLAIPDESLDVLLYDPDYESGEEDFGARRENLRRRLMIEMLQGQVLQDIVLPTAEQAEAWLLEQDEQAPVSSRSVELRSLRFDDADRAQAVHRSLRRDRVTFNEAVLQNTEDESQGASTLVEFASLPPEVQEAIGKLRPRWSSKPVEVGGSTYLFQVLRWIEVDADARIEAAREEMFAAERREAWERFVAGLEQRSRIRIFEENLPFRRVSP